VQQQHNQEHGIEPQSIVKEVRDLTDRVTRQQVAEGRAEYRFAGVPKVEVGHLVEELEKQMKEAAARLEFEKAALLRDQILELRKQLEDENVPEWERIWQEGHGRRG
jgi:excinuclease ABC subunit B